MISSSLYCANNNEIYSSPHYGAERSRRACALCRLYVLLKSYPEDNIKVQSRQIIICQVTNPLQWKKSHINTVKMSLNRL